MLIIRRMNCIDAASGIVLSVSGRPVHRLGQNCSAVIKVLINVHPLVNELCEYQNVRCNDKKAKVMFN